MSTEANKRSISKEIKPVKKLAENTETSIRNTFEQNATKVRNGRKTSTKSILKKKSRHRTNIPVLISRFKHKNENYSKNNGLSLSRSVTSYESSSSCKQNKKVKRKEWSKMPILVKTSSYNKPSFKERERSNLTMNEFVYDTNKHTTSTKKCENKGYICESTEAISKQTEIIPDNIVKTKTNIKHRSENVTKMEYIQKVSSPSLLALKRIISKKVRDYHITMKKIKIGVENSVTGKEINLLNLDQTPLSPIVQCNNVLISPSTSNISSIRSQEKCKTLAEENKMLLKSVTFKTTKFKTPLRKSMIPTRVLQSQIVRRPSKVSSLSLYSNNTFDIEEISLGKKGPKLTISTTETASFVPSCSGSPQFSFLEKNKENIKKIKKLQQKNVESREKKKNRKKTYIPGSRESSPNNRNLITHTVVPHDRNESRSNPLNIILCVLGKIARQIPQVIRNIFPNILSRSVDQETHISRSTLTIKDQTERKVSPKTIKRIKKFESNREYLPPWEEYKHHYREYSRKPVKNNKPTSPRLKKQNDIKEGQRNNLIDEMHFSLTKIGSKSTFTQQVYSTKPKSKHLERERDKKNELQSESNSMEGFYRRVMDTKSFCVQVNEKVSAAQQCCSKDDQERNHRSVRRKSWKVDYGTSNQSTTLGNLSFFKMLKAALSMFADVNSSSELRPRSARNDSIRVRRKNLDTDDSTLLHSTENVPGFSRLWKNTSKHRCKKTDKNLIYSYMASSMPKSSTSFLCPMLSDRNKPYVILNRRSINRYGKTSKKLMKGIARRKKGKPAVFKNPSPKYASVPDIFYEAQENNSFLEGMLTCKKTDIESNTALLLTNEEDEDYTIPNMDYINIIAATYNKISTEKSNEFLELFNGHVSSVKEKDSDSTVFVDDPIETCDFGCDVTKITCKDEGDMTDFELERDSFFVCDSQQENEISFREEANYKKQIHFQDEFSIDELITLLKQEFSDEND